MANADTPRAGLEIWREFGHISPQGEHGYG